MFEKLKSWLNSLYDDLTAVNESPHKVALSFAIGVFLGILPFTGVLAAITVAWFLHLNKPAAILGSAITNTWLGLIILGLAVQVGALCLGLNRTDVLSQVQALIHSFHWHGLLSFSCVKLLAPVAVGYVIVSLLFAAASYALAFAVIHWHRTRR